MRQLAVLVMLAALVWMTGCEERPPLSRAQVVSNASHLQLRDGLRWGEPTEVLKPVSPDAKGRYWWQLRYHPSDKGQQRIILVDGESGWARLPAADYEVRLAPLPNPSSASPVDIRDGSQVLIVVAQIDNEPSRREEAEREVKRLNELATNTGLQPLFGLRPRRDGTASLIYGWREDVSRGIEQNERLVDWLTLRTPYRDAMWEELKPIP